MFNNRKHIGISTGFNSGNGLSPKRSGVGATPLISTMKHEWYFNNVQNASGNIITIPDTGTVGGLDLSNPALANKPTQSSIGTKISWAADGLDDYMYKATTNFMRSMPTWMITVVFKFDSSGPNNIFGAYNETNNVREGYRFYVNNSGGIGIEARDSAGSTTFPISFGATFTDGSNYIFSFSWDGTNLTIWQETTQRNTLIRPNPILIPSQTDNISTTSLIAPVAGNVFYKGNIGYIGVDEFDLTRLNNNVATLKSEFGI